MNIDDALELAGHPADRTAVITMLQMEGAGIISRDQVLKGLSVFYGLGDD